MAVKKTSALAKLRILIREEVKNAIREEMPSLIKEALRSQGKSQLTEAKTEFPKKPIIPGTLNTTPYKPAKQAVGAFKGNDPISKLLNETAINMVEDDTMAFTSDDVQADGMNFFQSGDAQVGSVDSMLATARSSSDPSMVQINEVPDFNDLMKKMIAKGVM